MNDIITFFWLMVGIIAFIVIAVAITKRVDANDSAKYTAELRKIRFASLSSQMKKAEATGLSFDDPVYGRNYAWAFAVDKALRKVALFAPEEKDSVLLGYDNIISAEIIDESGTVYKKSTGSMAGRAIVGGIIAGRAGAAVGALSANTEVYTYHSLIVVKIMVRDCPVPALTIPCYDARNYGDGKGLDGNDPEYRALAKNAQIVVDTLGVAIDTEAREERARLAGAASASRPQVSASEEILRLAQLRSQGLITEDEFLLLKAKVIAGGEINKINS